MPASVNTPTWKARPVRAGAGGRRPACPLACGTLSLLLVFMVGCLDCARGEDAGAVASASARVAQPDAPTDLRVAFLARYARLKAEAEGLESISFPAELLSRLREHGRGERPARGARRVRHAQAGVCHAAAELEHMMRLATIEVKFVEEKRDALNLHVEALRAALANHDRLAAKGQALAIDRLNLRNGWSITK